MVGCGIRRIKNKKYKCLRIWKKENSEESRLQYRVARNRFKASCRSKKTQLRKLTREKLENCTSSDFWKYVSYCKKKKMCSNEISSDEWKEYFRMLLSRNFVLDNTFKQTVDSYMEWHDSNCNQCKGSADNALNVHIKMEEIEDVINKLDINTSPGLDGIGNAIIKNSRFIITPMLCVLFNKILESGIYPDDWCYAVIVTIHKNGSLNDPNNFRGISLLSCISKVFTKVLSNRLYKWAEDNHAFYKTQSGFQKGKNTMDNIFILQTLVSKYINKKKGRFYSIYVDFSKAFDSIPHQLLFYSLLNGNLHGKIITVMRNMYSKLKSCVQVGNHISEYFDCTIGTRQGCMVSPLFFILYLNELTQMIEENNCPGVYVNEHHPNITLLLYADDIVIVGDQVNRVQKILNILAQFCKKWGLQVNMSKTQAMVFRNGGIIKQKEVFYFNGTKIDIVSYYKYLGLTMSSRLSWSPAQETLAAQANKAIHVINQVNYNCGYSFKCAFNIFDKCVNPIISYGSEIWGPDIHYSIENVQLKFSKRQLGVGIQAPNYAVLGECGRDRMYVVCNIKCIKYWLKLIQLSDDSLLKSCYNIQYQQCLLGKRNWVYKVKDILQKFGFGWSFEEQNVLDIAEFLKAFIERIKDCELQHWSNELSKIPKLRTFRLFKENRDVETYLLTNMPRRLIVNLARFRISNHCLQIEIGRHENMNLEDRLCKLCATINISVIEDEYHVLFDCCAYNDIRNFYIKKYANMYNQYNFISLMKTKDEKCLQDLANFILSMFKIRKEMLPF